MVNAKPFPINHRSPSTMFYSRIQRPYILVVALLITGIAGWVVGNSITARLDAHARESERLAQIDEYQGLADRSGITGDVGLSVEPASQTVKPGAPIKLTVRLTNQSRRRLILNSWIEPYPAMLGSNQLPLKVDIKLKRQPVTYHGDSVILPLHTRRDFFSLKSGESRSTVVDIAKPASGHGRWDMSVPGTYEIAVWYETYLSGKWIGVKAWTGMSNPYVVQVVVK